MTKFRYGPPVVAMLGTLVRIVGAQQRITAATCANPAGFTSCFQQANTNSLPCFAQAGSDDAATARCACDLDLAEIGCALESCWNVVYGCEYQSLAFLWDAYCFGTLGDIPFFPAPENAPGGCSCNLGHIVGNFTAVSNFEPYCVQTSANLAACLCCEQGGEITSVYSICPSYDLSGLGLNSTETFLKAADSNPSYCAPFFNQYDCVNDLGFPRIGTLSYLRALPSATGTLQPSTTGGSITTPLYGSALVLTAGGSSTTITPSKATAAGSSSVRGSSSQVPTSTAATSQGNRSMSKAYASLGLHVLMIHTIIYLF